MIKRNEVWIKAAAQLKETTDKLAYLKIVKDEQNKILQKLSESKEFEEIVSYSSVEDLVNKVL